MRKIILLILCLLLSGCHSAPKGISEEDLMLVAISQSLQVSNNRQTMDSSYREMMGQIK